MSHATDQARSTRGDARAFADAFTAADDAFTFGGTAGQSRTVTLDELGDAIALPQRDAVADPPAADEADARDAADAADRDRLLTLDELSDALARPSPATADGVDFDFGTSAHERARLRTAARLEADPAAHAARQRSAGPRDRDRGYNETPPGASRRFVPSRDDAPGARDGMAAAAASAAERLADPQGSGRFVRDPYAGAGPETAAAVPVELRPSNAVARLAGGAPVAPANQRPDRAVTAAPRLREIERRAHAGQAAVDRFRANPDRIAMWAVLLGILLVLIAVTSGSGSALAVPLLSAL